MNKKRTQVISDTRQEILTISKAINTLANTIVNTRDVTKGSIYEQKKKCGHRNCKCYTGKLHTTKLLSFNEKGRTRLIPLTKYSILELSEIERQVKEYQKFRKSRAKMVNYFKQIITDVNKLERSLLIDITTKKGKANGKEKTKR